jgi:cysteine desulfurase
MGLDAEDAASSVRFSLGVTTTDADVDLALKAVPDAVARLREG